MVIGTGLALRLDLIKQANFIENMLTESDPSPSELAKKLAEVPISLGGKSEAALQELLDEARQQLLLDYEEALAEHRVKLAALEKREQAAAARADELEGLGQSQFQNQNLHQQLHLHQSGSTVAAPPLAERLQAALAAAGSLAGTGVSASPLDLRFRAALELIELHDELLACPAVDAAAESQLVRQLTSVVSALETLGVEEFSLRQGAQLTRELVSLVTPEDRKSHGLLPQMLAAGKRYTIRATLKNGFLIRDFAGVNQPIRPALVSFV